jgi:hypothetical protein
MTMNPETGEGFDAVQVGEQVYFDPNATDPTYPGSVGLEMRKKTYWQGDVEFDTFETVGPKFGPKWPDGTMRTSGLGVDTDVWGLSTKDPPPPGYAPWLNNGVPGGGTASGTNIFVPARSAPNLIEINPKHDWTPCVEIDGSPTMGEGAQRNFIDITLLGAYGGDIKFPVMPEEFGADFTHEYWTPRVVGLGEIIMPGGQSMETISWDSFFPSHYDSDYMFITPTELEDPRSLTSRLIWTMRFKMNCMLVVGGGIWNDQVVITNFNYRHKAGEIFDIYYTISMKRYRAPIVTTSPNPDSEKDRWPKDPRKPGATTDSGVAVEIPDNTDPNPAEVPVVPDTPTTPPTDHTGGRDSLIHIETTLVVEEPLNLQHVDPNIGYIDPNDPNLPDEYRHPGETLSQVMGRVNSKGPNDMSTLLALNQWVLDNHYDPYTSPLKVGSGVRYYSEQPVSAAKPTVIDQAVTAVEGAATAVAGAAAAGTGAVGAGLSTGPVGAGAQLGPTTTGSAGTDNTIGMPKNTPSETPRKGMPPKF